MFCPKCGAQLPDGTTFCTSCGQPLAQQAAPQQQAYQQPQYQQPQPQQYQQPYQPQYQQQYQQPQYQQPQPYQPLPTQPFTSDGILKTFLHNLTNPKSWGVPQFIALGASFLYFMAMIMPYVSYGSNSSSYFSAGASSVIPAIFLILGVCSVAFTKNGIMMCGIGLVAFFRTLFGGASVASSISLSVGFVFMLLASIACVGAGVFQFILEKKN